MAPTHDPKRRALGKGLESLLPQRPVVVPTLHASSGQTNEPGQPLEIPVDQIDRNPFQTRTRFDEAQLQDLANSIAATGVVQPITVRPLPDGRYQLITGERRLLASRKAGKSNIPCILRTVSDEQSMEMTIVENLQRADLNPIEQAHAYQRLATTFKMTQEQMAARTGKDRASVANFLRLLRLPEVVQNQVEAGSLTFGHARTLLALPPESIEAAAHKVQQNHLSVRQTEAFIHSLLNPEPKQNKQDKPSTRQDPNVHEAQQTLQRSLGLKVKIEDKKGKGKVIIEYSGIEDFDAILTALGQSK